MNNLENEYSNLYYLPMDFSSSEMDYFATGTFDTIFCISVLEDLNPADRLHTLKNFRRLVKNGGRIVITMDALWESFRIAKPYPTVNIKHFINDVSKAKLKFVGDINTDMPDNAVHQSVWNLSCYHCVLERA